MPPARPTQLLTIGEAVAQLRQAHPEVTASALHFLERGGLLTPARSPGGHRLYSDGDLQRVRIIKAWQHLHLPLADIRQRLAALDALEPPAALARRFLQQAVAGQATAAARDVLHADALGVPVVTLFEAVLLPVLHEVGTRWAAGTLAVGQEHEISEAVRDLIGELTLRHAAPQPALPTIVAACPAGERHDIGLRMICGLLRQRGARVHFLGADVAAGFLQESVELRRPDLVLVSITLESPLAPFAASTRALAGLGPHVVAGGQAFEGRQPRDWPDTLTVLDPAPLDHLVESILSLAS